VCEFAKTNPETTLTQEELSALIREVGLGHMEETLMQAARPSLRLHLHPVDEFAIPIGGTKFGGGADLPPDFTWPIWQGYPESDRSRFSNPEEFAKEDGPQEFLLQLRLEDLAAYDLGGVLPTSGILYFFCATWKAALGWDETDRDCWKVFHYDGDLSRLARRSVAPSGYTWTDQPLTCLGIEFQHQWTLPDNNDPEPYELLGELPGDYDEPETEYARYLRLLELIGQGGLQDGDPIHRLLGLPQIVQSGRMVTQDHVPGHDQEWHLLLQLDTEDVYDTRKPDAVTLHWQGSGRGYFYIPTQALAEQNFDAVWVDMQCT